MEEEEKKNSIIKELIAVTLATPAAFGLLAQVDKRLELNAILERIVINYDLVLEGLRQLIIEFVNIDLSDFAVLILGVLVLIQITVERFFRSPNEKSTFWGILSVFCVIISFEHVFQLEEALQAGNEHKDVMYGFVMVCGTLFMIGFGSVQLFKFFRNREKRSDFLEAVRIPGSKERKDFWAISAIAVMIPAFYLVLWFTKGEFLADRARSLWADPQLLASAVGSFLYTVLFILVITWRPKGPSYVALWFGGILLFNWIAEEVIPGTNQWLDGIGAA